MVITAVLDTNILLNAKNGKEPHSIQSLQILDAVEDGFIQGIISVISIAELCTGYYSQGDKSGKEELLAHLISTKGFVIVGLDIDTADTAAKIRADTGLRLPDAIIIATGLAKGAKYLVTHDKELKKASHYLEIISSRDLLGRFRHIRKK
ncbi:type II toxin-antitoxin system VapC family toxin [Candidatus Nitrosotalea okcheonensis]|uniref:Ribonuclease VapC n=1 Tax=Candidatus Nitrosotalea okcheonensis TaxID=1903276 RepID=A0A2H1FHN3_9ARCH|nr:PIN domain-containing protein [Candidatus Nitrosotalea okcheonensis]SMH72275.1 putative PilT protein domain protein [Candidatus Nitrosotalea okcheonensis]